MTSELLLSDVRPGLAEGEALDLAQGAAFYPAANVAASSVEDMKDCDVVVITAGKAGRPEQSRLELLRENAAIVRELASKLQGLRGVLVVVTNPVDVLTQLATEAADLPAHRVLGTGTMLDTARLRQILGEEVSIAPRSAHAQVIGEHGDSEVVLWSSAYIGGVPVRQWRGWSRDKEQQLAHTMRRAAYEIIQRKGSTNHAIGLVTASLLQSILRNERRVLTVSQLQTGTCGVRDVALSLPAIVGAGGVVEVLEPQMDAHEHEALLRSANTLRQAFASI